MAEDPTIVITPTITEPSRGFPDAAAHNAKVIAQQASQDAADPSKLMLKADDFNTGNALDKLAAQVKPKEEPAAVVEPTAEEKAAAEAKAAADAAEKQKAADEAAASKEKEDELFGDAPQLPPDSSPKAKDSFAAIKTKAAQEISALNSQLEAMKAEKTALEEKIKTKPPEWEAAEKERDELKLRLAKLDVDLDPKFKEYDKKITGAHEFIYSQLLTSPAVTQSTIDEIKKYGGPENVNLAKLFEAIKDPTLQRIVESKVADIAVAKFEKDQAIKSTKENVSQYVQERQKFFADAAQTHTKVATEQTTNLLRQLDWYKPQTAKVDATPEAKKQVEDYNKFLGEVQGQVAEALKDDSPQMRAILITGTAQLFHAQREIASTKAELEATKKSLADVQAKYDKVRSASRSRLPESQAPANGQLPKPKPADQFNLRAQDALDIHAKEIMEKRQAAGVGA